MDDTENPDIHLNEYQNFNRNDAPPQETKWDRKKKKKDEKKAQRVTEEQGRDHFEYEEFVVKEKDENYSRKNQRRQQRQEQNNQTGDDEDNGGVKKSKPVPAKSSFVYYKEKKLKRDPEMTIDQIKNDWKNLPEDQKQEYIDLAAQDKERHRSEMEEYRSTQVVEERKKGGKDRRRN